jgi:uncharacterized protein YggU (UPF0235/DUF167 family)
MCEHCKIITKKVLECKELMYIKVKVTAGAKKEFFDQKGPDSFVVFVKEQALRNMANTRVKEILARYFETTIPKIRLISGHRSPSKIFSIPDPK